MEGLRISWKRMVELRNERKRIDLEKDFLGF